MTDFSVDRRAFLKTTGGGALLAGIGSQQALASDDVAEGLTVYIGGADETLYAIDAENGNEVWTFTEPSGAIESSPTVAGGVVYFGTNDGTVYAVDAAIGDRVWSFDDPTSGVRSSPTVVDGQVYVGSVDSTLYAIDAASGTEEWAFSEPSSWVDSSPVVVDGTVYVGAREGFGDGAVYAIDATTGDEEWNFTEMDGEVQASVTLLDGVVYAATTAGELFALDAHSGTERWSVSDLVGEVRSPVALDESVYVVTSSGFIHAFDAENETERWEESLVGVSVSGSSPTVANGVLYIGAVDGNLYARDIDDGSGLWNFTGPARIEGTPTATDANVYFGSIDGNVYAVNATSDDEAWSSVGSSDAFESSATVVADPTAGDSVGSRVLQGTLGHTDAFAEQGPTEPGIPDDPDDPITSAFEHFKTEKLGNQDSIGLAPRIDNLTTTEIGENQTVSENIGDIEALVEDGEIEIELAEEAIERMVLGEEVINWTLEGLTATEPLEDRFEYDLLFESSKALVVGLVESSYKIKVLLTRAKEDLLSRLDPIERVRNYIEGKIDDAVEYLKDGIRGYLEDLLGEFGSEASIGSGIEVDPIYFDIIDAGEEVFEEIKEGDLYEALRTAILAAAEPIADVLANRLLVAYETIIENNIETQVSTLNTNLDPTTLVDDPEFISSIDGARIERDSALPSIDSDLASAEATMNPESETLRDLLELALDLLGSPSLGNLWEIVTTAANIVGDLLEFLRAGFNAGFGLAQARLITRNSATSVNEIAGVE